MWYAALLTIHSSLRMMSSLYLGFGTTIGCTIVKDFLKFQGTLVCLLLLSMSWRGYRVQKRRDRLAVSISPYGRDNCSDHASLSSFSSNRVCIHRRYRHETCQMWASCDYPYGSMVFWVCLWSHYPDRCRHVSLGHPRPHNLSQLCESCARLQYISTSIMSSCDSAAKYTVRYG
jgi:hypothetical protein